MIFATRAVHCSANDVTEWFSYFITGRIRTILCAGSEVILLYKLGFVGIYDMFIGIPSIAWSVGVV